MINGSKKIDIGKNNQKIIQSFLNIGFPKEEAFIYVVLLEKGVLAISDISKYSSLKRTTIYPHIENLLLKDFIEKIPKGKRIHYKAKNPQIVYKFYQKKMKLFSDNMEKIESLYRENSSKSTVRFFETKQGLREVYDEMARSVDDIKTFFPSGAYENIFNSKEITKFEMTLKNYGGKIYDLVEDSAVLNQFLEQRKKWGADNFVVKKLPKNFKFSVDFLVAGKKTAIFSMKKKTAVIIEDREVAKFFKEIHKFIWKKL